MKERAMIVAAVAVLALTLTGCSKQKVCRCAVEGKATVRIIKIDKGECDQLRVYDYHNMVEDQTAERLLCTDYEFAIDSIYKE